MCVGEVGRDNGAVMRDLDADSCPFSMTVKCPLPPSTRPGQGHFRTGAGGMPGSIVEKSEVVGGLAPSRQHQNAFGGYSSRGIKVPSTYGGTLPHQERYNALVSCLSLWIGVAGQGRRDAWLGLPPLSGAWHWPGSPIAQWAHDC